MASGSLMSSTSAAYSADTIVPGLGAGLGVAAGHICLVFKWVQPGTPPEVRGVPIALPVLCRSLSEIVHSEFEYEG